MTKMIDLDELEELAKAAREDRDGTMWLRFWDQLSEDDLLQLIERVREAEAATENEPNDEQVEAAAEGMWDRYGDRGMFQHAAEHLRSAFRKDARAALVAAAGVGKEKHDE